MKPVRWLSMLIFLVFVLAAFMKNKENFLQYAHLVLALVVIHNLLAFVLGYAVGKLRVERTSITFLIH